METAKLEKSPPEPVLCQPVLRRTTTPARLIGAVRLPLAGPYRPWARLYARSDGTLDWQVRLWEIDRAVVHHVDSDTLRTFARLNGLRELAEEVEALLERAGRGRRA